MADLNAWLLDNLALAFGVLAALVLLLLIGFFLQSARLGRAVRSDQSFAIALLDDARDGVVISSLHGRANTRVFAKPVSNGESAHNLSDEETQAIRIAIEGSSPA